MRILLITQWFDPEPNNMKGLSFAKKLRDAGNDVQVLTGFPNYPIGKIYDGYKLQKYLLEEIDGIKIHRVYLYPSHDRNKWKRMLNYFSFGYSASWHGKRKIKGDIDVVYVYHPPITSTIAAFSIARKKKAKVVLDINDLWPDSITATGMMSNSFLLGIINKWVNNAYKKANAINVLSFGIKKLLIDRGVSENKVNVIPVWCNEDLLTKTKNEEFYEKYNCESKFTIIYAGAMGEAQGLDIVIECAKRLCETMPDLQFILVGVGTCRSVLEEKVDREGLSNVIFHPLVPPGEVVPILNCADVLFINLKKDELFSITIPSKTPLYMAAEKMIIAGLEGDGAEIIKKADCGLVFEPGNIEEMCSAVKKAYNMTVEDRNGYAQRGLDYYKKKLSFDNGVNAFNDLFKELICNRE